MENMETEVKSRELRQSGLAMAVRQHGIVFKNEEEVFNALELYMVDKLTNQEIRIPLTESEIADLDRNARDANLQIMKLEELKTNFAKFIQSGALKDFSMVMENGFIRPVHEEDNPTDAIGYEFHPPKLGKTGGITQLKAQVKEWNKLAKDGHKVVMGDVYGIVNEETRMIEYVTVEGKPTDIPSKKATPAQLRRANLDGDIS
jgi:hypothetical protein